MYIVQGFFGIIGQRPSVSKSNRLSVVTFPLSLLSWGIFYRFLDNDCNISKVLNPVWISSNLTNSFVTTLNSLISVEIVSVGHTNFLVKVE